MEKGAGCKYMQMGLGSAYHTKCCMASSILWPYGLDCHMPGPYHYACGGNNLHCGCCALDGIVSCPAPLPRSLGVNDS